METRLYPLVVLGLYQLSLLAGIVLLPVALMARKAGVSIPIDRIVLALDRAYERTRSE